MNDRAEDASKSREAARVPPAYPEPERTTSTTSSDESKLAAASGTTTGAETNIKETVEQILVAFILAFIFRAFVVEAFVIPTGSMAPTLMGAHMRFRCEDCGYEWTVNYPSPEREDISIPRTAGPVAVMRGNAVDHYEDYVFSVRCPNCGYKVQRRNPADPDNSATNPPVFYGDRILVLKYLYLFQEPRRWDVVVFKAPAEPQQYDYQQNYIKRLTGKPGETLMILDGDVYTSTSPKPMAQLTAEDFQIQRKQPRAVQESLWRIVYDNDHFPRNAAAARAKEIDPNSRVERDEPWAQPWQPLGAANGWDLGGDPTTGKIFQFNNPASAGTIQFNAQANPLQQSLTDWLAYDATVLQGQGAPFDKFNKPQYTADNYVNDVKLALSYQRIDGSGPLRLMLTKLGRTFIAELSPGKASLFSRDGSGPETLVRSVDLPTNFSTPSRIEFTNVDYRVTLRIDNRDVIVTQPEEYSPNIPALLEAFDRNEKDRTYRLPPPTIQIAADRQVCTIAHLSLWRDIYYLNRTPAFNGGGPLRWATPTNFPAGQTDVSPAARSQMVRLGPDEFFVCGDNSPISGDARYWNDPINLPHEDLVVQAGRVPRRFLLGKAFFVYWPAGYRPIGAAPALVPNFGDMRFIH